MVKIQVPDGFDLDSLPHFPPKWSRFGSNLFKMPASIFEADGYPLPRSDITSLVHATHTFCVMASSRVCVHECGRGLLTRFSALPLPYKKFTNYHPLPSVMNCLYGWQARDLPSGHFLMGPLATPRPRPRLRAKQSSACLINFHYPRLLVTRRKARGAREQTKETRKHGAKMTSS